MGRALRNPTQFLRNSRAPGSGFPRAGGRDQGRRLYVILRNSYVIPGIRTICAWTPRKAHLFQPDHLQTAWDRLVGEGW
jgi:hypothetical protein